MYEAIDLAYVYVGLLKVMLTIIAIAVVMRLCLGSRSYRYRKELVDMYVVGKIKKYAEKDNIDLLKELKEFKKSIKMKKDLDDTIEQRLSQRIEEETIDVTSKDNKDSK